MINNNNNRKEAILCFLWLLSQALLLSGQPGQPLIITNVRVIPMNQETTLLNQMVWIKDGQIEKVADYDKKQIPKNYKIINSKDKYLIPGLTDMHQHFVSDDRIPEEYLKHELVIPLTYGVLRARVPIGTPQKI